MVDLETYHSYYKTKQGKNEEIQNFVKLYLAWGLSVIPIKRNSKQPLIKWQEFQERKMTNEEIEKYIWENVAIITGKVSKLIVFDADNSETIQFLENEFEFFRKASKVVTRRGKHYYFYVSDFENIQSQKIYTENIKIDIKAEGGYVLAPPSNVNGHEYYWLDLKEKEPFFTLSTQQVFDLIKNIKDKLGILEIHEQLLETNSETKIESKKQKGFFDFVKLNIDSFKEVLKKHYTQGNRQNLCIYAAGFLLKQGFSKEEILQFFETFLEEVEDEEKKMRIAGVEHTIRDFIAGLPVKGEKGLIEAGIPEHEIEESFEKFKKIEHFMFVVKENFLYYLVQKKKKNILIKVGPYIEVSDVLYSEDQKKYIYVVKMYGKTYTDFPIHAAEEIKKRYAVSIHEPKKLEKFLDYAIAEKMKNPGVFISRFGWHSIDGKDYFITPSHINLDTIIKFDSLRMNHLIPKFIISKKEKLHELIKTELEKGSLLGILFLASASAPFLKYVDTSYSVFLSGPPGAGKSLSASVACNLFYDNSKRFNLYSTQVFQERVLYMLSDLPVLLDETSLEKKDEKIETLLYLVESQSTKGRSNIHLAVHTANRRNVLFITSEQEIDFQRKGAFRRCIFLNLNEPIDLLDSLKYIVNNKVTGAGYDYVDYYVDYYLKSQKNPKIEYKGVFEPAKALYFTLSILEEYYNTIFTKLREKLSEIVSEHEKRVDYFEFSKNTLFHIYFQNKQNFYDPEMNFRFVYSDGMLKRIPEIPKSLWGFREKNILYVFPRVLTQELQKNNVDLKSFLSIMKSKGVLVVNEEKGYFRTRLPRELGEGTRMRFYAFNLHALDIDQADIDQADQQTQTKTEIKIQSYQEVKIKEAILDALELSFSNVFDIEIVIEKLMNYLQTFHDEISLSDIESYFKQELEKEGDFSKSWWIECVLDFCATMKRKLTENDLPFKLQRDLLLNILKDFLKDFSEIEID